MNLKRRRALNRILEWVGYALASGPYDEEPPAHRAWQPDEDVATERRSVRGWVAADDARGLSYDQLRTTLDGVLAKTDGPRSATRNILEAAVDRLPNVVEGMRGKAGSLQPRTAALLAPLSEVPRRVRAVVEETRQGIAAFRGRAADRLEPVARLPRQVGEVATRIGNHGSQRAPEEPIELPEAVPEPSSQPVAGEVEVVEEESVVVMKEEPPVVDPVPTEALVAEEPTVVDERAAAEPVGPTIVDEPVGLDEEPLGIQTWRDRLMELPGLSLLRHVPSVFGPTGPLSILARRPAPTGPEEQPDEPTAAEVLDRLQEMLERDARKDDAAPNSGARP